MARSGSEARSWVGGQRSATSASQTRACARRGERQATPSGTIQVTSSSCQRLRVLRIFLSAGTESENCLIPGNAAVAVALAAQDRVALMQVHRGGKKAWIIVGYAG